MKGQDEILKMRRAGKSPKWVWIEDREIDALSNDTVSLAPVDVPEMQDWRFLVGLVVTVSTVDKARADRITSCCKEYAKRVITNIHRPYVDRLGWPRTEVIETMDTDGVMTWQK